MRARPGIGTVGAVVRDVVTADRASVVVVVAPGGSNTAVGDAIVDALVEADLEVERVSGRRAASAPAPTTGAADVTVATEAQWLNGAMLTELRANGGTVVVVHRPVAIAGTLAAVHAESYEHGAVVRLGPTNADELVDAGWTAHDADEAIAATNGRPDLLATWQVDGDLVGDVTIRLSLLDDTSRLGAELRAFGATTGDLAPLLDLTPEGHDDVVHAIESEGLTDDGTMPPGVLDAVRSATTPGRRSRVVDLLVEHAAPGGTVALADALAGSDDRSAAAGRLYRSAAAELVGVDQERSAELLSLAHRCGVDESSTAPIAAELALLRGDPADALRVLGDASADSDAALLAAAAWYALGDAAATADALAISALPELAPWAASAAGNSADRSVPPVAPDPTASTLADAVAAWLNGDHAAASDHAARALIRAPTSPHRCWPATPHAIAGAITCRLGDLVRAGQIAEAAVAERVGGPLHHRSELLGVAWCAARQGRLDDAAAAIDELGAAPLSPREQWIRAAVSCALAVRDPEPDDLDAAAKAASVALAGRTADLYDLELLGEIAAALARVGAGTVEGLLSGQEALLDRLGRPPHLEFDVAWVALLAALSVDDDEALVAAAQRIADHGPRRVRRTRSRSRSPASC